MIITAVLAFVTDYYGWSFAEQVALYLPIGFATMITVSFFTKPEDENKLNAYYSLLNTPVGQEQKLEDAGISVSDEDEKEKTDKVPLIDPNKNIPLLDNSEALKNGEGLLLVDLLSLRKYFSKQNYKVDLSGFGISWIIVAGYLLLAYTISQII